MTPSLSIPGYNIERMIARGGMAEVYQAEQASLGRKVAIKVLDEKATDAEFTTRFLQEAKLVASLNHTNLITIYDFGKLADGRLYLVMEYLTGGDLEERLHKKIPDDIALRIIRQLVSVLHFVHSKGVVHRDVKPANILFREDGSLVLTDFGIAKKIDNRVGLTQAGMMVGSPAYSSPEQVQGLEIDQRADIYSAGVVFLELLTGTNPFKADTFVDTAIKHIQQEVPRLTGNNGRFQFVIDKMLAKKPKDRYSTLDEVSALLDKVSNHILSTSAGASLAGGLARTTGSQPTVAAPLSTTARMHYSPEKAASAEDGSLDDLLNEALKEFGDDDFLSPSRAVPSHKPPVESTKNALPDHSGLYRNRPLPSILLDDDEDEADFKPPPRASRASAKPGSLTGNSRTRPLPDNLLDDLLDEEIRKLDDEL